LTFDRLILDKVEWILAGIGLSSIHMQRFN
jgi:hypothetical protein